MIAAFSRKSGASVSTCVGSSGSAASGDADVTFSKASFVMDIVYLTHSEQPHLTHG
jgi:hypothetical protein